MTKSNVESFDLDHRLVKAPYVRVAGRKELGGGVEIIKYDLRFCQPNKAHLEMATVHSIEHMMANFMRDYTDKLIGFAPMGCQTGFYAITNNMEQDELLSALESALNDILNATEVPAANERQCGWGANHDLAGAQAAVRNYLAHKDEWLEVMA
ncbi:S-ribosylhomocysteine lyase [Corynebacterium lizhenjunii]|uniref:S-ribosylhomocysteine lyase n=1 Tax=Corynebacterium lizhenjunii TaxID=2709394 RepID=A0A7T0KFY8_9CORY|nr:S-ribosylhomocysteine lyase [Corynebacterium lizhenjunii]QPK79389.1 S-ribosylhomocysteine lyase [Corynebacterium lizhenjunii]